jgi:hypothetical protein
MIQKLLLMIFLFVGSNMPLAADDSAVVDQPVKKKVVPANKAKEHVGEEITVELTVRSGKDVPSRELLYLDSEEDYKAPENLALVLLYEAAEEFRKDAGQDFVKYFMNKKIQVTGKVIEQSEQTRIVIRKADQIRIVK